MAGPLNVPTHRLHLSFFAEINEPLEREDPLTACSTSRRSSAGWASTALKMSTATQSGVASRFVEVRRRTNVIGRFPSETSALLLLWAVLELSSSGWRGVVMNPRTVAGSRVKLVGPSSGVMRFRRRPPPSRRLL